MNDLDKLFDAIKGLGRQKDAPAAAQEQAYTATYLVAGLGNPGREYHETRHNIGFLLVDEIARLLQASFTRTQSKALVTAGIHQGNRIILVKPQTFMNKSGHPVGSLLKFHKLALNRLLVAYDDVDLPFGALRIKPSGGSAGHKGMQSIIDQLGTPNFPRLRLGVGRPPGSRQAADYVLKPFSKEEAEFLQPFLQQAAEAALAIPTAGIEYAMTHFNKKE